MHIAGRAYDTGHGGSKATSTFEMAVSEGHTSCWVHKDLTVTTKQIRALLTAARALGSKPRTNIKYECKVSSGNPGWAQRLGDCSFRGTVTAGDGSDQKMGEMGAADFM